MHFTFIESTVENIQDLKISKDQNDNLSTSHTGSSIANAYFTSGDLVFNYNKDDGKIISFDGYLPYFDTLMINNALTLPTKSTTAQLFVADLNGAPIFSIEKLPLELSSNQKILHFGKGKSSQILKLSNGAYIGLTNNDTIGDVYLQLES